MATFGGRGNDGGGGGGSDVVVSHHATLYGHSSDVTCVDFSYHFLATCSSDKTVRLWDVSDPDGIGIKELDHSPLLGHRYTVYSCCFSPLGNLLASCSMDGNVIIWDPKTGSLLDTFQHPSFSGIRVCRFSFNSSYLASGGEDETLIVWDVAKKELKRTFRGHDATVSACAFTPDSKYIISGSTNGDLRLWDVTSNEEDTPVAYQSEGHDLGVVGCEFSPTVGSNDNSQMNENKRYLLATCGNDDSVRLFRVIVGATNEIILDEVLNGHEANVMCCRFSSNGKILATASGDKTVILWNVITRNMKFKLVGHQRYVTSCAFSMCDNYVASGSNDRTILVWKIRGSKLKLVESESTNDNPTRCEAPRTAASIYVVLDDSKIPSEYYCPITHEMMKDPVIAADGFSYERKAIVEWFQTGKMTSPMTNTVLTHTHLTPNFALKTLIQSHLTK